MTVARARTNLSGMPGVLRSFRRSRSRLLLVAAFLAFAGQAVAVLIAPAAEARASQSAPAHVEQGGTHKHHAHNPNDCPACIALQIVGVVQRATDGPVVPTARHAVRPAAVRQVITTDRFDPNSPRPPPAVRAPVR